MKSSIYGLLYVFTGCLISSTQACSGELRSTLTPLQNENPSIEKQAAYYAQFAERVKPLNKEELRVLRDKVRSDLENAQGKPGAAKEVAHYSRIIGIVETQIFWNAKNKPK